MSMYEPFPQHELIEHRFKTIEEVYKYYLGFNFPENPNDMPSFLLIKPEVYGDMLAAILKLEEKDNQAKSDVEAVQTIGFLQRNGTLTRTKIFSNLHTDLRSFQSALVELSRWFGPLWGQHYTPLTFWHIHTSAGESEFPTADDYSITLGERRKSLITAHASPTDITCIFQTRKGSSRFLPLSVYQKGFYGYDVVKDVCYHSNDSQEFSRLAAVLESFGFVLYRWKKGEYKTVAEAARAGAFQHGIPLTRVHSNRFSEEEKVTKDDK